MAKLSIGEAKSTAEALMTSESFEIARDWSATQLGKLQGIVAKLAEAQKEEGSGAVIIDPRRRDTLAAAHRELTIWTIIVGGMEILRRQTEAQEAARKAEEPKETV